MAVRVYRAPVRPSSLPALGQTVSPTQPARLPGKRSGARSHAASADSFEENATDSHIALRLAQKESRAGRREFEAARKQARELREDDSHDF